MLFFLMFLSTLFANILLQLLRAYFFLRSLLRKGSEAEYQPLLGDENPNVTPKESDIDEEFLNLRNNTDGTKLDFVEGVTRIGAERRRRRKLIRNRFWYVI